MISFKKCSHDFVSFLKWAGIFESINNGSQSSKISKSCNIWLVPIGPHRTPLDPNILLCCSSSSVFFWLTLDGDAWCIFPRGFVACCASRSSFEFIFLFRCCCTVRCLCARRLCHCVVLIRVSLFSVDFMGSMIVFIIFHGVSLPMVHGAQFMVGGWLLMVHGYMVTKTITYPWLGQAAGFSIARCSWCTVRGW